jgi:hypothetical protein
MTQYYTNGTTITTRRPDPLITAAGRVYNPSEATYERNGWVPCDPPEPVPGPTLEERLAPYMPIIERFMEAWQVTGIGAIPETWLDAIGAVKAAGLTADTALELDILWRQLLPIEDDLRAWLSQQHTQPEPQE